MELHPNSHEHSLFFVDGESETDELVRCSCCLDEICGARYSCLTCIFHLHKSCTELPLLLEDHPFHPQHPLALLNSSPYSGKSPCDICKKRGFEFVYHCSLCNFDLHTMCALSVVQKESIVSEGNGGKELFRYGAHQHRLMLEEEWSASIDMDDNDCFVCSKSISSPFFFCSKSRCRFRLHKSCADLPHVNKKNSFHPQHPLFLISGFSGTCQLCGQESDSSAYICKQCDFLIHPRCAFSNPIDNIKRVGEKQIQHFTHQHLLTLMQDEGDWMGIEKLTASCCLCEKRVASFPSYGCQSCPFIIHKSCAELPPRIKSHLHFDHFLFLFARYKKKEAAPYCSCCGQTISLLSYRCVQCGFMLHVNCFLSLNKFEKFYNHKHYFITLQSFQKLTCQTCGEEGYFSPWQCSSCYIMVHKRCSDLQRFLKIESHHHCLQLTYYLSLVHECDKMICKLCYRKVNVDYAAYYCSECNYAAHLQCAQNVGRPLYEEDNHDDPHASRESQNSITNSEITSSKGDDNKIGVIQHFSHKHDLTLIEQDLADHRYCEGCVQLIFPPFYSCKKCNFYLHKRCGESPRTIKHPFYSDYYLLTLDVVEEPLECKACQNFFNGFTYGSESGDFNLDLQCAGMLLEGLQHPCHEHPLFFPYTRANENCKGCGKLQKHILVCSECDFVLGYCCLRIPQTANHSYGNHQLKLAYQKEDESGEYYCDICEGERDPEAWFYSCCQCEFFAHIDCIVGLEPHIKCGTSYTTSLHEHPLTIVEKSPRKTPPLCSSCCKGCYSRMLECCQCNLHLHLNSSCFSPYFD